MKVFQMTSAYKPFFSLISLIISLILIGFVISPRLIYSAEFLLLLFFFVVVVPVAPSSSHTYVYYARRSYYNARSDGRLSITRILDMRLVYWIDIRRLIVFLLAGLSSLSAALLSLIPFVISSSRDMIADIVSIDALEGQTNEKESEIIGLDIRLNS